jgi:hypothetical protein
MKQKVNKKIVLYTLIGLVFMALTFLVDWIFIAGAALMVYLNQRELMKK